VTRLSVVAACLALTACGSESFESACPDAETRLGYSVCVHAIPDESTWSGITFPAAAVDQDRATTFLVPARSDSRVPTVFVDASAFDSPEQSLHFKFLTESFPEFQFLDYDAYLELVLDSERREWFAGSLTEYVAEDRDPIYGFTIWDSGIDPTTTITCEQFRDVHAVLGARVRVGSVAVVPATGLQRNVLADCGVPVHDPSTALAYEVYTDARGCGTVRRYSLSELAVAETDAAFGWQDILVTDEAPLDVETIVSGIVTGTRQGELSHLNVRSASRGTPNCYVRGAYELLAQWEGQLVQLECTQSQATIVPITTAEAQTCWEGLRPDPVSVVPADLAWTELVALLDAPTATASERTTNVGRFGSKGANLAALYQRVDADLRLEGLLIPFHYYDAFMADNTWSVDLGNGQETLSYAETIGRYLADPVFTSDGAVRRLRLDELRASMRATTCNPPLVSEIEDKILDVFGGDDVMVRFRSSSNAEDALGFNGAGLYDSTSVCLADETDVDTLGPSHCDADQPKERDVCRGLTKVWASLWNMKAFEERQWYGIDHAGVAMGILVNTRTKSELANVVAFTGNPLLAGDDRYLINAQLGELDVVSALPGVWPEKDLLTLDDGAVAAIERVRGSTELPDGQWVLDDGILSELGAALWTISIVYPVDEQVPPTADILLDTEWKLRSDGRLAIKQIRPFLR
jgi:hypothetical protein